MGRLPDFMIIGGAKCGTTTLYAYLCRHPQVSMARIKEPEYFAVDEVYARGEQWYRHLFAGARDEQICGEASTSYTKWPRYPNVPERIAQSVPNAKFIYIMRHPAEREYSWYQHIMRDHVTMSFEEAICSDPTFINPSMYIRQIEKFLAFFPREQFLFLTLDDLKRSPGQVLDRVQGFLGLPGCDLIGDEYAMENTNDVAVALRGLNAAIERWKGIPGLVKAVHLFPKSWRSTAYRVLLHSPVGRWCAADHVSRLSPLKAETRQQLLEIFRQPTLELAEFLGRDLSEWLY